MAIGWDYLGDLNNYQSKSEIRQNIQEHEKTDSSKKNDTTACWEFLSGLNVGDVVIVKSGKTELIGYGIVSSNYIYDDSRDYFKHVRKVDWRQKGSWTVNHSLVTKTLTNVSEYSTDDPKYDFFHQRLLGEMGVSVGDILPLNIESEKPLEPIESYSKIDALKEVFLNESNLEKILQLLDYKKNIILQGPPGTGKTFLAKRLAWLKMEKKDEKRVEMVQFHPSYSYEDFIRGFRPTDQHFELKDGIFMELCNKAKSDPDKRPYFLVID